MNFYFISYACIEFLPWVILPFRWWSSEDASEFETGLVCGGACPIGSSHLSALATMTDILNALRDATSSNRPITFLEGSTPAASIGSATTHIVLSPDVTAPRSAPTRFRRSASSTATDPQAAPGDFVSLEALLLVWSLKAASASDYMRQARAVPGYIAVTERRAIVEWLEGRRSEHDNIVPVGGGT